MSSKPFRILIAGIGGVGGYYGGLLAQYYSGIPDVSVNFMARGEHLMTMRQSGLRLKCHKGDFVIHPDKSTDTPSEVGVCDLILLCVKSYHLNEIAESIKENIGPSTIVLPLLNGIETGDLLMNLLPKSKVFKGFVYVNSHLTQPGVVEQRGIDPLLNFGPEDGNITKPYHQVHKLFLDAGISSELHADIRPAMWEKFILVGSTASLTTFYSNDVKTISTSPEFEKLVYEIFKLAMAKGVKLNSDLPQKIITKVKGFKPGIKSSMQLDFERGKQTELELFTGYIANESGRMGLDAPVANKIYDALKSRLAE